MGHFGKWSACRHGHFVFQNATRHFFLLIPASIMGKKSDQFLNSVMPLEPGEFWKEALFSSTSGGCLLLELSAPRALPYTEPNQITSMQGEIVNIICSSISSNLLFIDSNSKLQINLCLQHLRPSPASDRLLLFWTSIVMLVHDAFNLRGSGVG